MPATDLLLFTVLALIVGIAFGWKLGYRAGKTRADAEGEARRGELENRLKELQNQAKELLGIEEDA